MIRGIGIHPYGAATIFHCEERLALQLMNLQQESTANHTMAPESSPNSYKALAGHSCIQPEIILSVFSMGRIRGMYHRSQHAHNGRPGPRALWETLELLPPTTCYVNKESILGNYIRALTNQLLMRAAIMPSQTLILGIRI